MASIGWLWLGGKPQEGICMDHFIRRAQSSSFIFMAASGCVQQWVLWSLLKGNLKVSVALGTWKWFLLGPVSRVPYPVSCVPYHGSWILFPVPCVLCLMFCVLGLESCVLRPVSCVLCPGPWVPCPMSYVMYPGSCVLHPVSWVLGPVSWALGPLSHVLCHVSWVLSPESWVLCPGVQLWQDLDLLMSTAAHMWPVMAASMFSVFILTLSLPTCFMLSERILCCYGDLWPLWPRSPLCFSCLGFRFGIWCCLIGTSSSWWWYLLNDTSALLSVPATVVKILGIPPLTQFLGLPVESKMIHLAAPSFADEAWVPPVAG
jgi:hypothetical protein